MRLWFSPATLAVIGALITAGAAWWASHEQLSYERQLRAKAEEISALNKTIAATVTGGDSFCYLTLEATGRAAGTPLLMAVLQGAYPLYDASARITALELFDELVVRPGIYTIEQISKTEKIIPLGNLNPKHAVLLGQWTLPVGAQSKRYNIFVTARNGSTTEFLRLRRINGAWKMAVKVTRDAATGPATLYEYVDEGYPRDAQGQVDW